MRKIQYFLFLFILNISYTQNSFKEETNEGSLKPSPQVIDFNLLNPSMFENIYLIDTVNIIPVGGIYPWQLQIGDFNNNNKVDFVGNWYGEDYTGDYLKSAFAEYDPSSNIKFPVKYFFSDTSSGIITSSDLNKDGYTDFLTCAIDDGNYNSIRCFTNSDKFSYPDSLIFKDSLVIGKPSIGDFDGDDLVDMAIVQAGNFAFYEFDPDSNRFLLRQLVQIPNNETPIDFATGDFDNDGKIEFIFAAWSGFINSIENQKDNYYKLVFSDSLGVSNSVVASFAKDIDNNGFNEIFIMGEWPGYSF